MTHELINGDCLSALPTVEAGSAQTCVTSPPYFGLRDYGVIGQIGMEESPEIYVAALVEVFREVRRVLRADGTLWLNLGDSYAGNRSYQVPDSKHRDVGNSRGMTVSRRRDNALIPRSDMLVPNCKAKDLIGIPWMVAFALRADGWYLRSDIIWHKPNPMPESVTDRPTKAHEYLFLLSKSASYYYDAEAIKEPCGNNSHGSPNVNPGWKQEACGNYQGGYLGRWTEEDRAKGRNKRSVWTVSTKPFPEAHFATFPEDLIEPCILAGSREGDTVLDPFNGAGTTGVVAIKHGRKYLGCELNPEYVEMSERRLAVAEAMALRAKGIAVDVPRFNRRQIETPLFGLGTG